jgi:WD40 repeat protein
MPPEPGATGRTSTLRLDAGVRVWDTATGALVRRIDTAGAAVETFAANDDGTRLAVGLREGRVLLFSLPDGRLLLERSVPAATGAPRWAGLAFSRNGQWLAASWRGEAEVWNLATAGREHRVRLARGLAEIGAPSFSPDSIHLLTRDGRMVRRWNLESGAASTVLEGHRQTVSALGFDPQGQWVLSASLDTELRRWPLFASREALQAAAWAALPRCLSNGDRVQIGLAPATGDCRAGAARR